MVLEGLFGRGRLAKELEEGEYIELDTSAQGMAGKVPIRIEKMDDFADTDRIQKAIRDGSVVFVKIKSLKEKDMSELKRAIDKLRKTCIAMNGDIAGIDEDYIVLCPSFARVARA